MNRTHALLRLAWDSTLRASPPARHAPLRLLSTSDGSPSSDASVPTPTAEELDGGRRLARLAKMATALNKALKEDDFVHRQPAELKDEYKADIEAAFSIIRSALDKSGRPCTIEELADRISDNIVPIPLHALDYSDYLRAASLRDSFEHSFVDLQIFPPREAFLDNEGKRLCRLERRAERRLQEAQQLGGDLSNSGNIGAGGLERDATDMLRAPENERALTELRPVTEDELERRKAHLQKSTTMEQILSGYETTLLEVRRVQKVVKEGTTLSMRALVVIGDRKGTAGYGEGKSETAQHAIERACRDAKRNLLHLDLYQNRTIYHRVRGKFVCTNVSLWPKPKGSGVTGNNNNFAIFHLFGIKDVGAKVHGSRNLINAVKAVFNALSNLETPESICKSRGLQELVRAPPRKNHNIRYRPL